MRSLSHYQSSLIGAIVILLLVVPMGIVEAQNTSHLTLTMTGQNLTAGFNNTVTVSILNNFYSTIYDVGVTVSAPSALTMLGDNQWHYNSVVMGQTVNITFQVYAPTTTIGNSYQGSISVMYRQLGDISYTTESHAVSFSVHGWINLVLYGVQLTPTEAAPGGNTTVSGNILNSGNLAAYSANVTIASDALAANSQTSVFLGEVDPNIPRPFSLLVSFKENLAQGNYSLIVKVYAIDSNLPSSPYSAQQSAKIQIKKPTVRSTTGRQQTGGIIGMILQILRYLYDMFFGSLTGETQRAYSYFSATATFTCIVR